MEMNTSENLFFGDLLKQFRKRKRLNQTQLAEQIEVKRETVSLWERGQYKPEAEGILYQIVDSLGLTTQEQQQLFEAYTVTALATSFHNPPLKRNPYFTGRRAQLNKLHTLLKAGKQVALTQAISGLGGIGKTQLALEYAYRHQKSYHDIFWTSAESEGSLMASYVQLAGLLHLPEYEEPDQNKVKEAVQHWFRKHTGWLLILDNVEDLNLLQQFVPIDRQGAVLLTTRRHVTEPVAQALELELLPENDAILFLLKRTKVLAVYMPLEDASDHDIEAARAITRLLGNLPLALDQAGAYILETPCSFAEYLALFKKYQDRLLQRRIGERIPTDHPESVTATFTLSFQQVQQRSEAAAELLRVCSFLAPDDIGEEILVRGASKLGPILQPLGSDDLLLNQAIEALRTFSLIQRNPEKKTLTIHSLVQAVLQNAMPTSEQVVWTERIIAAMNTVLPNVGYTTWNQWERLVPHALACVNHTQSWKQTNLDLASLLYTIARYLRRRARYTEAELLYQRTLSIYEQVLGPDHPETAKALNSLALLYSDSGKLTQVEPLYQRALRIREEQLGPKHPDTAMTLNNLASLYRDQGKYAQAEPLYQRALAIYEQQLGPEHPNTANSLNNLALLYVDQGKYAQAEPLYQRVLAIYEEQLEPEHPDTAMTLNNLANLYRDQGKYAQAEPLYQRALGIDERILGPEHPQVARSLTNLALVYSSQGKYEQAEPLYQRALSILEGALGPDHPDVAYPLSNLANLYSSQGKYEQAEPLYQRALHIWEQAWGPEHPYVASTLNGLAILYSHFHRYEQAEPLYQRMLSIMEQALGLEHPNVAYALNNLGLLYIYQGKYEQAEPLYQRALSIREQALEPEHIDVAGTLSNLGLLYTYQGKYEQAEPLYQRALSIMEQALGPEHIDVATILSGLALLYTKRGKYTEAEQLYQRALRILERQLGPQDPNIAEALDDFASSYSAQSKLVEAESLYQRALAIREQSLGQHHPKTVETRKRYITLLREMGQYDEAASLEAMQSEPTKTEEEQERRPEE